jgi:hypothetical protein
VNTYLIGLYTAPQGTTDFNAFVLVGLATNHTVPVNNGRFNGGDPFTITNNNGQTIAFQVRTWSAWAGTTFEEARPKLYAYLGVSTIGEVTPSIFAPVALFGTNYGQVREGFVLTPQFGCWPNSEIPTVSITNLTNGQLFAAPANVPVQIRAMDIDSLVTSVSLLSNNFVVAGTNSQPYHFALSNLSAGYYNLQARAADGCWIGFSAPITIRVADRPVLIPSHNSIGPIQFQFNSATGITYVVERGGLTNFLPVVTNAGTGNPLLYSETNGSATQRTYRVRLE